MRNINRCLAAEKGFTLIELLVVVIILGVLAAIAVPTFSGQADRAKEGRAMAELKSMKTFVDLYALDNSRFPAADNDAGREGGIAVILQKDGINWTGDANGIRDPWGNPYIYGTNGDQDQYVIISPGPDGEIDGKGLSDSDLNKDNIYVTRRENPTVGKHGVDYSVGVGSSSQ